MSIAAFACAQPALAQAMGAAQPSKTPPKRTVSALRDPLNVPEPR